MPMHVVWKFYHIWVDGAECLRSCWHSIAGVPKAITENRGCQISLFSPADKLWSDENYKGLSSLSSSFQCFVCQEQSLSLPFFFTTFGLLVSGGGGSRVCVCLALSCSATGNLRWWILTTQWSKVSNRVPPHVVSSKVKHPFYSVSYTRGTQWPTQGGK